MAFHGKDSDVPSWDWNPSTFERFATEAPSKGLPPSADGISTLSSQPSEQSLAAPRVWHRLVGSVKSVVRNLDPATYSTNSGLEKPVEVLRRRPLQPRRDASSAICA